MVGGAEAVHAAAGPLLTHALERISLLLLVGGGLFEFITGVLDVQLDYVFPGSFCPLHFYGAWIFFAAFVAHAVPKTPKAVRAVRQRLREDEDDDLASPDPAPTTAARRGSSCPRRPVCSTPRGRPG